MYIESGVVPALLLQLTSSFNMRAGEQGLLGGIVFLSLSLGSPIAGFLLHHFDQQMVVGISIIANAVLTLLWAMTPVNHRYSTLLFISIRALMGFTQAFFVVYIPLWTNENSPRSSKTRWMGYYQMTVPIGIITGYFLSSIVLSLSNPIDPLMCGNLLCWRWPLLVEVVLLLPIAVIFLQLPRDVANIRMRRIRHVIANDQLSIEMTAHDSSQIPSKQIINEATSLDEMVNNSSSFEFSPAKPPILFCEEPPKYQTLISTDAHSSSSSLNTTKANALSDSVDPTVVDSLRSPLQLMKSIYDRPQSTSSSFTDLSYISSNPVVSAPKSDGKAPIYYESFRDISRRTTSARQTSHSGQLSSTDPELNAVNPTEDEGYYSGR